MAGLVEGRVAVVTGAASGIGRATALALSREGAAAVIIADIRKDPREGGTPTHEALTCAGRFVQCDVSKPADLVAAVAAADEFGGVDIMVNNAGVVVPKDFLDVTEEDYDRQMDINAKGAFFGTQAAAKRMVEKGGGVIINLSSILGIAGSGGVAAYSASKGAIKLMTYSAAQSLAPKGIRVNAIHPGVISTELVTGDFGLPAEAAAQVFPIPMGRAAGPDEIGDAIVLMCSDHARYMTGASMLVDGGLLNTT
ncbi:SDR family NAD(P)-dependent oxidoreductase [Sporichthya sp.]|uniref:SDR family NAD(P)-dependent oxidoreductase n=1 Tax=Sporichthya sp. TaxID=65475 RepID=UPI0018525A81|nr:SDR family oxidoreductase [Sporichthya sp.]MBA3743690.1 SDR family oxidoreductase [Sporichthya sp.]